MKIFFTPSQCSSSRNCPKRPKGESPEVKDTFRGSVGFSRCLRRRAIGPNDSSAKADVTLASCHSSKGIVAVATSFGRHVSQAKSPRIVKTAGGYALLDVVLALAIFSIAVTSLVVLMQKNIDTSASFARDRLIQNGIDSFLTETKRKPVKEMNGEFFDEGLDVNFRAEVESLELANVDGDGLKDLYKLTVTAEFEDEGGPQVEVAELYIYQPERK